MKRIFLPLLLLISVSFLAQKEKRPDNWFNLDPEQNKINGVSTERTYKELLAGKTPSLIIVGVLDSGVDFNHEDLKDVMWTNPGEIPGNGIDDDKNGYVDDIHGWNFLGNKDGRNVECENLECTRLVRKLKPKYEGKTEADFSTKQEKEELKLYGEAKKAWTETKDKFENAYNQSKFMYDNLSKLNDKIKSSSKVEKWICQLLKNSSLQIKMTNKLKCWLH